MAQEIASQTKSIGRLERRLEGQEKIISMLLSSRGKSHNHEDKGVQDDPKKMTASASVNETDALKIPSASKVYYVTTNQFSLTIIG